jgi:hypothetical protein
MIKNPFLNALLAVFYIVVIVFALQNLTGLVKDEQTFLAPIVMLSLFVLSTAVMGLLFVYTPAIMFLDNQKEKALTFFLKTLGTFAYLVVVFIFLLFLF